MAVGFLIREMVAPNSVLGRVLLSCSIILAVARAIDSNDTKCTILGLRDPPSLVEGQTNVFMTMTKNESMSLSLQCSCTHLIPYWTVYKVESQESFSRLANIQECKTNETGEETEAVFDCQFRSTFLQYKVPGVRLVNFETFSISETTILMCSDSREVQETVIITVSPDTDNSEKEATSRGCENTALPNSISETVVSVVPTSTSTAAASLQVQQTTSPTNLETTTTTSSSVLFTTATITQMSSNGRAAVFETTSKLATLSPAVIKSTSSINGRPLVTSITTEPVVASVQPTVETGGLESALEFVDSVGGIPIVVVIPVTVISLLLNVVLIFCIICCRRKKGSSRFMEVEDGSPTHSADSSSLERANKARSIDRLLPTSLSATTFPLNSNSNHNNNNSIANSTAALRTSQSAIVISNHSVDLSD